MVVNIDKFIDESELGAISGGFGVAPISWSPEIVQDISGPPTLGTLPASSINTHDHPNGSTTGLKFEFTVPDDYDSGPLELQATYAMSTAVGNPNNQVVLSVGAEIADVTGGGIDTGSYPQSSVTVTTPDNLTTVTRTVTLLSIAQGDFATGDKVVFLSERLGGDGSDLHTGSFRLIDYMVIYDGQVAARASIHQVESFTDTAGTPAVSSNKSSFDTLDFQETFTHEQKFQFTVPDNWDGVSDFNVRFTFAMTSAAAANVRLDLSGDAANVVSGAITALPPATFIVPVPADTDVHRTTVVFSISGLNRNSGDPIVVEISRPSGDALDTHPGDWQLIAATVFIGQGGSVPVSTEIDQGYLTHRDFRIITVAGVNAEQESPDFAGDFEIWAIVTSSVAAGRADIEWQGRLRSTQTKVTSIIIPIRGQSGGPTPQYQVKVYAEGSGASPVFTGVLTAETTGNRIVIALSDGDLSAQPTGERRFFVVVEVTCDAGEELRVGTPFVRQE